MTYLVPMTRLLLVALVMLGFGCKKDDKATTDAPTGLSLPAHTTFLLELGEVTLEKLIGENAERVLKFYLSHNEILMFTLSGEKQVFTIGMSAPPASYGKASYSRIRGRTDGRYIWVPNVGLKLVKDDGAIFSLDIAEMRLSPEDKTGEDGLISGNFTAQIRGSVSIDRGDSRMSGEFFGTWTGKPDSSPPRVTVIPPAEGIVSGSVEVYFDQPVDTDAIASRVFLRDGSGKTMKTHITVSPSEIDDFTTHLLVETLDFLPFNQKLSLAVGTAFKDLAGVALERPYVTIIKTPDYPPLMNEAGNDFGDGREKEYRTQGDVTVVPTYASLKPYSGRFLKIVPPPSGSRTTSALVSRIRVSSDADILQVRVAKIARTRDPETPALRFTVAEVDGLVVSTQVGPTDVPRSLISQESGEEYFTTPWVHLNINVGGHRGRELVFIVEARPMTPDMKVQSEPVFLVDLIRVVWEGQDPNGG